MSKTSVIRTSELLPTARQQDKPSLTWPAPFPTSTIAQCSSALVSCPNPPRGGLAQLLNILIPPWSLPWLPWSPSFVVHILRRHDCNELHCCCHRLFAILSCDHFLSETTSICLHKRWQLKWKQPPASYLELPCYLNSVTISPNKMLSLAMAMRQN